MPEKVTNELMLEVLKEIQNNQKDMKAQLHGIREEIGAIRTHMSGFQTDIGNLYAGQVEMKKDLDRVQARLNLTDA